MKFDKLTGLVYNKIKVGGEMLNEKELNTRTPELLDISVKLYESVIFKCLKRALKYLHIIIRIKEGEDKQDYKTAEKQLFNLVEIFKNIKSEVK